MGRRWQWTDGNDKVEFRKAMGATFSPRTAPREVCDLAFDDFDIDRSGEILYTEYIRRTLLDALSRERASDGRLPKV